MVTFCAIGGHGATGMSHVAHRIPGVQRIKHWRRLLRSGYRAVPALISYVVLIVGGSAALGFAWGRRHLLWGLVLILGAVIVTILEGSFREARRVEQDHAGELDGLQTEHAAALAEAQAKAASPVPGLTFVDNKGTISDSPISNIYNAGQETPLGVNLLTLGPGSGIERSIVHIEWGDSPPAQLPEPVPSSAEERAMLRDQVSALAGSVETVMAPFAQRRDVVAVQMGIREDEFMARMPEILAERRRIDDKAVARYNDECRPLVIQAYGHARSIGFADAEMERIWQTTHGLQAERIPACLRRIATQISG